MQFNRMIVASAGAGKTTKVVKESIESSEKILITTFTKENSNNIKKKFYEINSFIPNDVTITPWYSFLLKDFVRPFQSVFKKERIKNLKLMSKRSAQYAKKNTELYFFVPKDNIIYSDKMADFGIYCNDKTKGSSIDRIVNMYDHIYIDEIQDITGSDLDFVELLINKGIRITLVGDIRQATFSSNKSSRNSKYKGLNLLQLYKKWEEEKKVTIETMNISWRCNQSICDYSDSLFEAGKFKKTISKNDALTGHDGVFYIYKSEIEEYMKKYNPTVLRDSKKQTLGLDNELNIGRSKGLTFNRVLISTPKSWITELKKGNKIKNPTKLYIAVTRSRFSSTLIVEDGIDIKCSILKKYSI